MKLEQEQEERSQKDESEREKRQRWEDRPFMANMMTLQMNLMCGSSNYGKTIRPAITNWLKEN
jgi:hypothetical protein